MTDPKGSDLNQAGSAATEKKPAAKRAGTKKSPAGKDTAEKKAPATAGKKNTAEATSPKSAPASETSAVKAPAKKTAAKPAAATASAKEAKPAAKKAATPRKRAAPAEAAPAKKPVEKVATTAAGDSARKPAAKKAAAPKNSAPETEPEAEKTASAKPQAEPAAPKPRGRAPKKAAGPAASESSAAPQAAEAAPVEAKSEAAPKKTSAKRSSGRRRSAAEKNAQAPAVSEAAPPKPQVEEAAQAGPDAPEGEPGTEERGGERKRRGRSRRGRRKSKNAATRDTAVEAGGAEEQPVAEAPGDVDSPVSEPESDDTPESTERKPEQSRKLPRRKMFVCVQPEEQVEVVISEEGQVQEYYVEMLHQAKTKGNIYKASISNVDANLQAAFVNYGAVKNGFLQIDEVHPEYYVASSEPGKGRKYPPIQKVLKPGQEVLVQVVKEPTGTKGAFLTTFLSLAGRFLVLTPGREQIGVSRKVENEGERSRLREMLGGLTPGPGLGVIVRTVSMGVDKTHLEADLAQLKKRWTEVRTRGTAEPVPTLIYQEMDLVARAVRDYLTDQVAEVWVDDEKTAKAVAEVAAGLFPRKSGLVRVHGRDQHQTLFERFNIQRQVEQIHSREVTLPSGGRLVIDPTEALTAIDINSGRSGGKNNFEDMAYRTNLEAAKMIPLQLRLRDIGGQVVVDFIEMRDKSHWREVEKTVRQGMKVDRARYDVGKMGPFGMLEIVRQRLGSSAISVSTEPCPHCKGSGVRRNMEWQSQQALREIQARMQAAAAGEHARDDKDAPKDAKSGREHIDHLVYEAEPDLAMHLMNQKRRRIAELEQAFGLTVEIRFKHPDE